MFLKVLSLNNAYLAILEKQHAQELYTAIIENRAHLSKWLPWVGASYSLAESRGFISNALQQHVCGNGFQAGIWYNKLLVGVIGLHPIDQQNRKASIGYWLGAEYEGKGLMSAAVSACLDYCYGELKLNRVEIRCAAGNTKSQAVPVRLGFQREGMIRQAQWLHGHFVDLIVYGMLAAEWEDRALGLN